MTVLEQLRQVRANRRLHLTLLDPDKQSPQQAGRIARMAAEAGSDAIMVGGSSTLPREEVNRTVVEIKKAVELPVILFPSGAEAVAPAADAIFFMSLLNSRLPRFLMREQKQAAPFLRKAGIEPIPMGYLIIEPGMRVGEVGQADLIGRDDADEAAAYAMAAEDFGMAVVYLEAGSGAPVPVSTRMVAAVRQAVSMLVCVGGGIRSAEQAAKIAAAGADMIVTGTLVERETDVKYALESIINTIRMA